MLLAETSGRSIMHPALPRYELSPLCLPLLLNRLRRRHLPKGFNPQIIKVRPGNHPLPSFKLPESRELGFRCRREIRPRVFVVEQLPACTEPIPGIVRQPYPSQPVRRTPPCPRDRGRSSHGGRATAGLLHDEFRTVRPAAEVCRLGLVQAGDFTELLLDGNNASNVVVAKVLVRSGIDARILLALPLRAVGQHRRVRFGHFQYSDVVLPRLGPEYQPDRRVGGRASVVNVIGPPDEGQHVPRDDEEIQQPPFPSGARFVLRMHDVPADQLQETGRR